MKKKEPRKAAKRARSKKIHELKMTGDDPMPEWGPSTAEDAREKTQTPPNLKQWFGEQVDLAAQAMNYSEIEGKDLVSAYIDSKKNIDQLLVEIHELRKCTTDSSVNESPEFQERWLKFASYFVRQVPDILGTFRSTYREGAKRVNRNQINKNFGLFKLSIDANDTASQNKALENLYGLSIGIANKKDWFHPEGSEGWKSQTNLALTEQLRRFSALDYALTLEYMVDYKFSVVGRAIRQRLIDEIRRLELEPVKHSLDVDLEIPDPELNAEERALRQSAIKDFETPEGELSEGERGIWEGMADLLRDPVRESQTKAELVKRDAAIRKVTHQQARNDRKKFLANRASRKKAVKKLRE